MEEKFLKGRQEREETRANRVKEVSEITEQRQQFVDQVCSLEETIEARIRSLEIEEAKTQLNALRALVQDAANSMSLTAHDMAKFNGDLTRLQQSIQESTTCSGSAKKFKFSSKTKAAREERDAAAAATAAAYQPVASPPVVAPAQPHGAVYGPVTSGTLHVGHSKAAFIKECSGCTVLCLPVAGSVFLSGCTDCTIYVACHQLRMKDCRDVSVYVWCASTPIIEKCEKIGFGPYTCWKGLLQSSFNDTQYGSHEEWVERVGDIHDLERTSQTYTTVDDFQWLRKTPSPHWHVIDAAKMRVCNDVFAAAGS